MTPCSDGGSPQSQTTLFSGNLNSFLRVLSNWDPRGRLLQCLDGHSKSNIQVRWQLLKSFLSNLFSEMLLRLAGLFRASCWRLCDSTVYCYCPVRRIKCSSSQLMFTSDFPMLLWFFLCLTSHCSTNFACRPYTSYWGISLFSHSSSTTQNQNDMQTHFRWSWKIVTTDLCFLRRWPVLAGPRKHASEIAE